MTAESNKRAIRRALVSVYDKTGLEDLARGLHEAGVELVSTGSTAAKIAAAGVPVTKVEELTGFLENGPTDVELEASLAQSERSWLSALASQEETNRALRQSLEG